MFFLFLMRTHIIIIIINISNLTWKYTCSKSTILCLNYQHVYSYNVIMNLLLLFLYKYTCTVTEKVIFIGKVLKFITCIHGHKCCKMWNLFFQIQKKCIMNMIFITIFKSIYNVLVSGYLVLLLLLIYM